MSNINKQAYHPDGGDIVTGRLKEIADNPYGDEEKCWLAKRVLALLDELEAAERRNAEFDQRIRTQNRHACELFDEAKAQRQRVAELEAREVVLPPPQPDCYGFMAEQYNIAREACAEAIRAAGISLNGEG